MYNNNLKLILYAYIILYTLYVTYTGLISWVPNSDTLHDLIRDFRCVYLLACDMPYTLVYDVILLYDTKVLLYRPNLMCMCNIYTGTLVR